jgi:hypothetical protein
MAALLVTAGLLAVACAGSASTSSFRPGGGNSTPAAPPPTTSQASADSLLMPPFGRNARIVMTSWLPASAGESRAVIAAKNFLLAILYADYTGGRDHRWLAYVGSSLVRNGMTSTLAAPSVTTESFRGTIRIWRMSAVTGTYGKNTISVTECFDSARALNTSLRTGKVLPPSQQNSTDQNYYSNTDVLARNAAGQWTVISIPSAIYYPEALECKP